MWGGGLIPSSNWTPLQTFCRFWVRMAAGPKFLRGRLNCTWMPGYARHVYCADGAASVPSATVVIGLWSRKVSEECQKPQPPLLLKKYRNTPPIRIAIRLQFVLRQTSTSPHHIEASSTPQMAAKIHKPEPRLFKSMCNVSCHQGPQFTTQKSNESSTRCEVRFVSSTTEHVGFSFLAVCLLLQSPSLGPCTFLEPFKA